MKAKEWAKLLKEKFDETGGEIGEEFLKLFDGLVSECSEVYTNRINPTLEEMGKHYGPYAQFRGKFRTALVSALREACVKWDAVSCRLSMSWEEGKPFPIIFERGYFAFHKLWHIFESSKREFNQKNVTEDSVKEMAETVLDVINQLGYSNNRMLMNLRDDVQQWNVKHTKSPTQEYLELMIEISRLQTEGEFSNVFEFVKKNEKRINRLRKELKLGPAYQLLD